MKLTQFFLTSFLMVCFGTLSAQAPNYVWAKRIGGSNIDEGRSIVLDASGNSYITGFFRQTADFDPGPGNVLLTAVGLEDIFITKLDQTGNWVWTKTMGGANNDYAYSIALDASGNIYTTGQFIGTCDFDPGAGTFNMTSAGSWDVFVSKLDPSGNFLWAKRFGSTIADNGRTITTDASGNVFTIGTYTGTVDFDPGAGTSNLTAVGMQDVFISKLDASGNFVWAKSIGGAANDEGRGIVTDASGNAFITGFYNGTVDFDPNAGTFSLTGPGSTDSYLLKLDAAGNFVWAISTGGTGADAGNAVTLDGSGNIFWTGNFSGTADHDPGASTTNLTSAGSTDIFFSKLTPAGALMWVKQTGSTGADNPNGIATDPDGAVYTTGSFTGTVDFDPGSGTLSLTSAGVTDIYISKLDASGNLFSAVRMGGILTDVGYSIAYHSSGTIYSTGVFDDVVDFNPGTGTANLTTAGSNEVYIQKLCQLAPQPASISGNATICSGTTNTYSITPVGTATSYTWTTPAAWTGTSTTNSLNTTSSLTSGNVSVTANNACGSSPVQVISVTVIPTPTVPTTITGNPTVCTGSTNIYTTGFVNGATSYNWTYPAGWTGPAISTIPSVSTIAGASSGLITVSASNSCGTTAPRTFTVTVTSGVSSSVSSQTNVSCNGGNNGSATVLASGGTAPYTYSWAPSGGTAATATSLTANTYSCTITDATGCSNIQTVTITQPAALGSSVSSQTNISCNGGTNGSATIAASGGAGGYTYLWAPSGGTSATASSLGVNTYTCTITDANGCTRTQTVNITQPTAITSSVSSQTNVSCNGGNNGAATITATGGTGSYTYSWAPSGGNTASVSGRTAGVYTCTITDANGCTRTQTVSITQPTAITSSVSSQTNVSCNGGTNGAATITATGGTGSYTYAWAPSGGNTASVSGRTAGIYTCTITDANGCTRTQTVNITQPAAITSSVSSQTNVSCNGGNTGSATILAGGGAGGFTYSWAPSGGTAATASGLTANTYTCTITDANGCTRTQTVNITQPAGMTSSVTSQTNVSCNGGNNGAATISVTGGSGPYTYSWAPSGGTGVSISGRTAAVYTCTITDAGGCTRTQTVNITQPAALASSVSSQTNISCNGGNNGSATIAASGGTGGYTYSWAPSGGTSATASSLGVNTYTCTITDANGCTRTQTVSITQPTAITSSVSSQTNVSCNGGNTGSATVLAGGGAGGFTYLWTPSGGTAATASGLTANTFTCTITDANGCTRTQTVNITQPTAITSSVSSQTNVSCNGGNTGSATVLAGGGAGGFTYSWAPSGGTAATASGLTANNYTCTITDANGCTRTQTVNITQPAGMTSSVTSQTNVSCNGGNNGAATISVTGGSGPYTYSWAPSGGTGVSISGRTAAVYTCTITDAGGCTRTQTVNITQPAALTSSVSSQTNISCNGGNNGSATIAASGGTGGYTYSWAPSGGTSATASSLGVNTYTCTITDANGCTRTQTVSITQPTAITSSVSSQTNVSCNGGNTGSATINATGGTPGYTYAWAPSGGNAASASGLAANTYTCTITDANGCTRTQTVSITQPTAITSSVSSQTNVTCNGGNTGSATINATGGTPGYTYAWLPSGGTAATASGLGANTYTCTITDANGCTQAQTVSITQPLAISSSLSSGSNISCFGANDGTASVIASGGTGTLSYSWMPSGGNTAAATSLIAGTYTCTITDANGCQAIQTTTIIEPAQLTTSVASQTSPTCFGGNNGSITLNTTGGTGTIVYAWMPSGGNNATANNLTAGTYTVIINDVNNCQITETITLTQPLAIATSQTVTLCAGQTLTVGVNTYTTTGIYTDVLTSIAGCDSTVTTDLTVEAPIDLSIQMSANTIIAVQAGATYQWIDCNNGNLPIAGETGQTFSPVINGNYAVIITMGSCSDTSACSSFITSIAQNQAEVFEVFPNPSNGQITIQSATGTIPESISIINPLGQLVNSVTPVSSQTQIQLPDSVGMYLIIVNTGKIQTCVRVIKQ